MRLSYKKNTFDYVRALGQGNFASVVLYQLRGGMKQCIVKTIKEDARLPRHQRQGKIKQAKKALFQEYQTYQKLGRPVSLQERGSQLVIEDPTVGAVLNQHPFGSIEQLNTVFSSALSYLVKQIHTKNIIHYDIKLQNMIIDAKGEVEFIDYGSSKQVSESNAADDSNADSTGIPLINLTALIDDAKDHVNATLPKLSLLEGKALIAREANSGLLSYLNLCDFERLADGKTYDILALVTAYLSALGLYQQRSKSEVTWQSVSGLLEEFKDAFEAGSVEAKALYHSVCAVKEANDSKASQLSLQSLTNRSALFAGDSDSDSDSALDLRLVRKKRKASSLSPLCFETRTKKPKLAEVAVPRFISEQAKSDSANQMPGLSRSCSAGCLFRSSRRPLPNPARACSAELPNRIQSRRRLF